VSRKIRIKGRKSQPRKLTRFPISRKTELLFAFLGVLVIVILAIVGMAALAPRLYRRSPRVTAAEKASMVSRAQLWERLLREGVVVREEKEQENIFVDEARWSALPFSDQDHAAAAAADRSGAARVFVKSAANGSQVGLYTRGGGYKAKEPPPLP
jgi:hypothetical protein